MKKGLINKYQNYAATEEAFAVLFVRNNLRKALGHWVDITDSKQYEMSDDKLHFRYVRGGLFRQKIDPMYPKKSMFTVDGVFNEKAYILAVRAITWETAKKDIKKQKEQGVKPLRFNINGIVYDKNKDKFFIDETPPEIRVLEKNLSDRTNPLWDKAMGYMASPEFVYKIKNISIYK
ncbi:hypothetical protein L5M36_14545 [Shewanella sp. SM72]|uniref:hypothetical protein n=1 Tax=Shewanella sp. SM72 TaxID=2912805 RepID=UPI0021DB2B86|nr:hypothetical protein [Shewanella sp. SM72]MCU8018095.1 hypothetical protein [Shewanella sp. SM72]